MTNIFKKASRLRLRFTYKGSLSVEDLWNLPMEELNELYKSIAVLQSQEDIPSLLEEDVAKTTTNDLRLAIIKEVYQERKAEIEEMKALAQKKAQREKIKEILAEKQDNSLASKSEEELQELLKSLDN